MSRIILFLMLICSTAYAEIDVLPAVDTQQNVAVLNENLRQLDERLRAMNATNTAVKTVSLGGTGASSFTAYSVIAAGTTSTGAFHSIAPSSTVDYVLMSNGSSAYPSFKVIPDSSEDYIVGTAIESSATTDRSTTSTSWTKIKEFSRLQRAGQVAVYFRAAGGPAENAQVYINGVAAGIERNLNGCSPYCEYTENFTVSVGDSIQIYANQGGDPATISEFQIKCLNPTVPQENPGY